MSLNLPDAKRMLEVAKKSGKVCMSPTHAGFHHPIGKFVAGFWKGKFHLQHMVVETYFFRRTISICMAPRDRGSTICCGTMLPLRDLAYWVQNDPNLEVWDRRAPTILSWAFPWT